MNNYIVTGVTSGIGRSLGVALLEKGNNILGIGRDESKVSDLLERYPNNFRFHSLDLSEPFDSIPEVINFAQDFGKFDGMVSCAGKEETLPLSMYSFGKVEDIFNVNFHAPFQLLKMLSKKKITNDGASFVLLSSVMGELGQAGKTAYCSSKAAILGLVRASALELASRKIRVNAVSPGVVETPMTEQMFEMIGEDKKQTIRKLHPLGFGEIEDVIPLICFLLSEDSRWITGQNFKVDGGYSIQ